MVFTDPQVAVIGVPYEADAADRVTGAVDFADQGRARVDGANQGGLRIWAGRDGTLMGAEMLGPAVEHLAHLLTHAIGDGKTARAVLDQPIYHPTVEEGFSTALSEITHSTCQS